MSVRMKAGQFGQAMDAWARGGWTLEGVGKAYGGIKNAEKLENRADGAVRAGMVLRRGFRADGEGRRIGSGMDARRRDFAGR